MKGARAESSPRTRLRADRCRPEADPFPSRHCVGVIGLRSDVPELTHPTLQGGRTCVRPRPCFTFFLRRRPIWRADERPADEIAGPVLASGFAELDRNCPAAAGRKGSDPNCCSTYAGSRRTVAAPPALRATGAVSVDLGAAPRARGHRGPRRSLGAGASPPRASTAGPSSCSPHAREGLWAIEQALRAQHLAPDRLAAAAARLTATQALPDCTCSPAHSALAFVAARHASCVGALAAGAAPAAGERTAARSKPPC